MSTSENIKLLHHSLRQLEKKGGYDADKYAQSLLQMTKELEFFYCKKAKGKNPDHIYYYLNRRPMEHSLAYFNLSRGYPKELMDGHWCYVIKDFGVKMLIVPCTSLKEGSKDVDGRFQKDIEIICENKHMNVRLQITDMRCVDVMRLDERKPFYQVVNQQEEIYDYIISRIFDN